MQEHPTITDFYANSEGEIFHFYKGVYRKIDGYINTNGYILFREHNRHKILAHRFVYEVFYGIIPEGMQIDHINGVKTDNRILNLRLATPKENQNNPITKERMKKRIRETLGKPVNKVDRESGKIIDRYVSYSEAVEKNKETKKRIYMELHSLIKNNTNDYYFTYA